MEDSTMYHHILIPLDGSKLAEQALTHLREIVHPEDDTRITLLQAVPLLHAATVEFGSPYSDMVSPLQEINQTQAQAQAYLDNIAADLRAQGYHVQTEVVSSTAREAITDYVAHHRVDLIAMATHGRSGVSRWLLGSVTDKVVQSTRVPVLVIRPRRKVA
jgi:nucleotide-binding universal stress UspA family protein